MRLSVLVAALSFSFVGLSVADESRASIKMPTHIPPQPLGSALQTLAKERGFQVVYESAEINPLRTKGAAGELSSEEALIQILSGTGLTYEFYDDNAVSILPVNAKTPRQARAESSSSDTPRGQKETDSFRLAQESKGALAADFSVEKENNHQQDSQKKPVELQEVVVTGTRIVTNTGGPQDLEVYTRERIERSGQSTVSEFLNTLPNVSVSLHDNGLQAASYDATVQLHGLPVGTTLVLLNGRRLEGSGTASFSGFDYFNLNNIPLSAVDRLEVLSEGSSAVYGSDALAGVVNIVLKKNLEGLEGNIRYGFASATHDWTANFSLGHSWESGSFSIIGSFQTNTELEGAERDITADADYSRFGGRDRRLNICNPGDVYSLDGAPLPGGPPGNAGYAAVSSNVNGGRPAVTDFGYGVLNACTFGASSSLIPQRRQAGILAQGNLKVNGSIELFAEFLFNREEATVWGPPPFLYGAPGYQAYTASASNPFNPFGERVGVSYLLTELGRTANRQNTDFVRPLIGARGDFLEGWHWELAGWLSTDRAHFIQTNQMDRANAVAIQKSLDSADPVTALNPFTAGTAGSPLLLSSLVGDRVGRINGQDVAMNAFARGALLQLPSGPIQTVFGAEYVHNNLDTTGFTQGDEVITAPFAAHRDSYSGFSEARVPLFSSHSRPRTGDILAGTVAARYDHYSDFGHKVTSQYGVEWRPVEEILLRGAYATAFKAPTLTQLHSTTSTFTTEISDPLTGNANEVVNVTQGGNPNLKAETGRSRTFGLVYSSQLIDGLRASVTNWDIKADNVITLLDAAELAKNESLFPGYVIRPAVCSAGPPCPIAAISNVYVNFGQINVAGLDYQIRYSHNSGLGEWTPSLSVTQTYRYTAALTPAALAVNADSKAQGSGNWAPRWKGIAELGWKLGPYAATVSGRYVGSYQDYGSTRRIGNFWLYDANFRYAAGEALASTNKWLAGSYVSIGGVNLFNRLPEFSMYQGGGYDMAQADIRGRYLYLQVGSKL